jgi:hypothetical protein
MSFDATVDATVGASAPKAAIRQLCQNLAHDSQSRCSQSNADRMLTCRRTRQKECRHHYDSVSTLTPFQT